MASWLGAFVVATDAEFEPHQLDCSGFVPLPVDAINVRTAPEGITIPTDVGKLIMSDRMLFGPFLKEALEKCAVAVALFYSNTGGTPKLVTEAKKYAVRASKFSGTDQLAAATQKFVDALPTVAQVFAAGSLDKDAVLGAFGSFQTLGSFKKKAADNLADKFRAFEPIIEAIDELALPPGVPRREMLGIDRGNLANIYRNVLIGMIYFLDGDLNNAQLYFTSAYATSIWWAQLFVTAEMLPSPPAEKPPQKQPPPVPGGRPPPPGNRPPQKK